MLVQEEGYGHTSLAAGSRCTAGWVRRYFQQGEMPDGKEGCKSDRRLFDEEEEMMGQEDELGVAVRGLRKKVRIRPFYWG